MEKKWYLPLGIFPLCRVCLIEDHDPGLRCPVGDEAVLTDTVPAFVLDPSQHKELYTKVFHDV